MITLASTSAARAAMLEAAGVTFTAVASGVDEEVVKLGMAAAKAPPDDVADALAEIKAVTVSRRLPGLVLGADQVLVTADGTLLDKPTDRAVAEAQLRQLAGTEHRLETAAVIAEDGRPVWRANESAKLTMRALSDAFVADYLDREGEAVLACVGCYRIEGLGAQLFTRVEGDPFVIQGLPLLEVLDYLRVRGELAG
ncbi:MAG: Maf-like protein [Sphingomonadaceae bacterium]|nr:Maf-like protein [Sphingomonadaceae bacterium]